MALHFAHSAALTVLSSTLEISLNSVPVSSILLTEQNQNGWITIPLDPDRLKAGYNQLSFQLVGAFFRCMPADEGIWAAIYENSYLHLPRQRAVATMTDLVDFPQPLGPTTPIHPGSRCNVTSLKMGTASEYAYETCETIIDMTAP